MASQDKQDKMKELTDRLEQGIKDVYNSEQYKTYLATMSKFHSYSFRNSLLIMLQKPEATHVAGFNAWQSKFKRHVNKGEKGIQILAPSPYRIRVDMEKIDPVTQRPQLDNNGNPITENVEITKPAFRPVYVFDVSQTSGEPLPELTAELTGSVHQYNAFFESLQTVSPFPMQFEDIQGGAKGYCDPVNQKIAIKTGMSEIQNIKTAIHEITHADLHADQSNLTLEEKKDRRTKEVEAESVAFVVCSHYGIDTSDYSFAYLASWSSDKELNELKNSLDTIQKQAAELIDRVDTRFQELLKEQPEQEHEPKAADLLYESEPTPQAERTFTIYQLKAGEDNHYRRFESYENLQKQGEKPEIQNYDRVYAGKMGQYATLDNIYQEFNINRPTDFKGHSLSMSDIIVIEANGVYTANYVDTYGFVNSPDFARQHEQEIAANVQSRGRTISLDEETGELKATLRGKQPEDWNKEEILQYTVETDLKLHGAVQKDTLEVLRQEGYFYLNGTIQKNTDYHADTIKHDNDIDLDRVKNREQLGFRENETMKGNSDYYKTFYAGSGGQDKEAIEFQKSTGWNRIWGSDNDGLNGDTWIVYRSLSDLPKGLQDFAAYQEKHGLNVAVSGENLGKPKSMAERLSAAKATAQERSMETKQKEVKQNKEREEL